MLPAADGSPLSSRHFSGNGLHCALEEEEEEEGRLSGAQEGPSLFDNHTPALVNQTSSSSHELHLENQRKEQQKKKSLKLEQASHSQLLKTGEKGQRQHHLCLQL